MNAVVLLSGGVDSSVLLYYATFVDGCDEVFPVMFDYNQRHKKELAAAVKVVAAMKSQLVPGNPKVVHPPTLLRIPLDAIGGSPLSDPSLPVPDQGEKQQRLTVVPYRNLMMLSVAASFAEVNKAGRIYIGACGDDQAIYRDCRHDFFEKFNVALRLGGTQEKGPYPEVIAPFADTPKDKIVAIGNALGVPFDLTWTCYKGGEEPCHVCDACHEREAAFAKCGDKKCVKVTRTPARKSPRKRARS
jgi:7-cyano-7-deazaguanine synthase